MIEEICEVCGDEQTEADADLVKGVCEQCLEEAKEASTVERWDLADEWYIAMRHEGESFTYWLVDGINSTEINFTNTDLGRIIDLGVNQFKIEDGGVSMAHAE
jgi:hypothetical protein